MEPFPAISTQAYDAIRQTIKSGDILLCSGTALFSTMIQKATNSCWSHVAFILRLDIIDRIMVLESVESIGVRAVPLSSYVYNYNGTGKGYPGRIMLARHSGVKSEHIRNLSKQAVDLLGLPYDSEEILRIAARISMNPVGLNPTQPDRPATREFICSEYAYTCFKSIGITIDYNPLGFIAPADFARCSKVTPMSFIRTESKEAAQMMSPSREHQIAELV
jgi:hypothetical protein